MHYRRRSRRPSASPIPALTPASTPAVSYRFGPLSETVPTITFDDIPPHSVPPLTPLTSLVPPGVPQQRMRFPHAPITPIPLYLPPTPPASLFPCSIYAPYHLFSAELFEVLSQNMDIESTAKLYALSINFGVFPLRAFTLLYNTLVQKDITYLERLLPLIVRSPLHTYVLNYFLSNMPYAKAKVYLNIIVESKQSRPQVGYFGDYRFDDVLYARLRIRYDCEEQKNNLSIIGRDRFLLLLKEETQCSLKNVIPLLTERLDHELFDVVLVHPQMSEVLMLPFVNLQKCWEYFYIAITRAKILCFPHCLKRALLLVDGQEFIVFLLQVLLEYYQETGIRTQIPEGIILNPKVYNSPDILRLLLTLQPSLSKSLLSLVIEQDRRDLLDLLLETNTLDIAQAYYLSLLWQKKEMVKYLVSKVCISDDVRIQARQYYH